MEVAELFLVQEGPSRSRRGLLTPGHWLTPSGTSFSDNSAISPRTEGIAVYLSVCIICSLPLSLALKVDDTWWHDAIHVS